MIFMRSIPEPVKPDATKPNLLIIDDSQGQRIFVRTILEVLNVTLTEACNGADALDLLATRDFHVVVTDLEMGSVSGFDVIKALDGLPTERRRPRVIVCSALVGTHAIAGRAELMDATALLQKPVRPGELLGEVIKALDDR
jgi:CheY-like chemotaxis protein